MASEVHWYRVDKRSAARCEHAVQARLITGALTFYHKYLLQSLSPPFSCHRLSLCLPAFSLHLLPCQTICLMVCTCYQQYSLYLSASWFVNLPVLRLFPPVVPLNLISCHRCVSFVDCCSCSAGYLSDHVSNFLYISTCFSFSIYLYLSPTESKCHVVHAAAYTMSSASHLSCFLISEKTKWRS